MKYAEPEVILINSATVEIQGIPKEGLFVEGPPPDDYITANAYEADE